MDEGSTFPIYVYDVDPRTDTLKTAVSYDAGYIVLSCITSAVGCVTTLELLKRRTSTRGVYNWFLLLASAITMGGIGIWGMHFVANRAVILEHGVPARQIQYNTAYTAISFFLPILVLLAAFYMLGIPDRVHSLHLGLAGVLTGTAVCGMHYVGQLGIENYRCSYQVQNVIGAAGIAVVDSLVALSIFFRLRDAWTDGWWKRVLCGVFLSLAVSGMHWTAAVGTIYEWKGNSVAHGNSRMQASIIASSLSIGSCIVLLIIAIIRGRNIIHAKVKAQSFVLACTYFDESGRLMVTQEGGLPGEKITNHSIETTFGENELSRYHATFMWAFKVSCNWLALGRFIPGMKECTDSDPVAQKFLTDHAAPSVRDDSSEISVEFTPIFKQLFCIAAQQLANLLNEPLEKLGVLFEEPLDTGAIYISTQSGIIPGRLYPTTEAATGATSQVLARGKYLFLVRQLTKGEVAKFATLGYRFASVGQIAEPLARNMQADCHSVQSRLERMKLNASADNLPAPGVHLACFMVRPSMYKSFDILVSAAIQSQLPLSTLQSHDLSQKQLEQLQRFDELTINEILRILVNPSSGSELSEEFRWQLYNSFVKLVDLVGDPHTIMQAKFSATKFEVPCRSNTDRKSPATCTLLFVRLLRSIHTTSPKSDLVYVPLPFFSAQQLAWSGNYDETFTQRLEMEFSHFLPNPSLSYTTSGRTGSEDTRVEIQGSARSRLSKALIGKLYHGRRSDETSIVDSRKIMDEAGIVEMTVISPNGTSHFEKSAMVTQADIAELASAAGDKGNWVTEAFSLFQLGAQGWGTGRPGWKWDINVERSFEVETVDRDALDSREQKTVF